jgi:hypothetical protein
LAAHIEIGPAQARPLIRAGPPGWTGLAHLTALHTTIERFNFQVFQSDESIKLNLIISTFIG